MRICISNVVFSRNLLRSAMKVSSRAKYSAANLPVAIDGCRADRAGQDLAACREGLHGDF